MRTSKMTAMLYHGYTSGKQEAYNTELGRAYTSDEPLITLVTFNGKSVRPSLHYRYQTIEQRNERLQSWIKSLEARKGMMDERKQTRKEATRPHIAQGAYFATSWGYDQTNIDYLVVVSVSKSGKTATCRRATSIHIGESGTSDILMPGVAAGDVFTMQVDARGHLHGSYPYMIGESSKHMGYFSPVELGEVRYETMAQFGH